MQDAESRWPLGVFASIDAGLGVHLEVARDLEIATIQLHAPSARYRTAQHAAQFLERMDQMQLRLSAVFGGFEGESYATIETTRATVGLVPVETRAARLQEMKQIADFARSLDCSVVGLHLGFIPAGAGSERAGVVDVTRELCDHCGEASQNVHLETGQETSSELLEFIHAVDRENLFVNFDPANMIVYGTGHPLDALRQIGVFVRSVHCKDAKWSREPGKTWGTEVKLGEGDVDMEGYLRALCEIGYRGPLTIEREIPRQPERQRVEIAAAAALLRTLRSQVLETSD